MRVLTVAIGALLLPSLCLIPTTASNQAHPSPPGMREAQTQSSKPLEPPLEAKPKPADPAKLKKEADELAQLSAGIPSDISLLGQGQIQKDLADKLRRIEKLAKHLRSEVTQ
jgi:hypothetical protein